MYYVCIENDQIVSVLNYEPNVPESVEVHEISDEDHELLKNRTHYFSIADKTVNPNSEEMLEVTNLEQEKQNAKIDLAQSDWKVLRHIREKALGIPSTLTEEEYIELENNRQQWATLLNQ
jgi:hypothetical protein